MVKLDPSTLYKSFFFSLFKDHYITEIVRVMVGKKASSEFKCGWGRKAKYVCTKRDINSILPEAIICHILSFLPTKDVVGTSILSKRWRYLWTSVPTIEINDRSILPGVNWELLNNDEYYKRLDNPETKDCFMDFVDRVLRLNDMPCLRKVTIRCTTDYDLSRVSKWISIVATRDVEALDLRFFLEDAVQLPPGFFTCRKLVFLKLHLSLQELPTSVFLPSLKNLHIHCLEPLDEHSINQLIEGCPILEELEIINEIYAGDLTLIVRSSSLKSLRIDHEIVCEDETKVGIVVDATNLERLDLNCDVRERFDLNNLSSLVEVKLDYCCCTLDSTGVYGNKSVELLRKMSNTKYMCLCYYPMKMLEHARLDNMPMFHNLILLDLCVHEHNWQVLPYFLESSPNLKTFVLCTVSARADDERELHQPFREPKCLMLHLEEIQLFKFRGCGDEMKMVRYFLKNAAVLKEISICSYYSTSSQNERILKKLVMFPRTSNACQIAFESRLLIAYENGLIILWDVSESRVVMVRGNKDLRLKDEIVVDSSNYIKSELSDDKPEPEQVEKDISSICWASLDGSILAVGYVDGDILLWNLSTARADKSSDNVVKLQLSSEKRRLPVIVLRWSRDKSVNNRGGQLFVYGGDEIGSEEVLTILKLDWSSGLETLKCVGRADLTLSGSFADLSVLSNDGAMESNNIASLCVLTNPGQLHVYDDACLSAIMSQQEKKTSLPVMQYPMVIPIMEPYMTVGKLGLIYTDGKFSRDFSEIVSAAKVQATHSPSTHSTNWPLTGGVPSQLSFAKDIVVERVYVAGYHDGTVRLWDATYPSLLLIVVIESMVKGMEIPGTSASISALDFCSTTLSLAIGNETGLVRFYKLIESSDETSFHFVTETEHEVHNLHQGNGAKCAAVFSLLSSPVRALQFANFGARLAVGYECGRVAVLDIRSLSTLFLTDCVCGSSSPIISLAMKSFSDTNSIISNQEDPGPKSSNDPGKGVIFILTKDAHVIVIDVATGSVITSWSMHPKNGSCAISMYILEGNNSISEVFSENHSLNPTEISGATNDEAAQTSSHLGSNKLEAEPDSSTETTSFGQRTDGLVLFCGEDALLLYSMKSVIQGNNNSIRKVNLVKPCCWTTTFNKDDKVSGLVVMYPTGVIEIRSLPDLEVVRESSLMSILRWNFKTNMEKTLTSSSSGQITMANGSEFAFVSLLASENDFRIPESLPCLHDKVLAAAADAAVSFSFNQNRSQDAVPGILGGLIKGFKVGKMEHNVDLTEVFKTDFLHLESIFSRIPLDPSTAATNDEALELNIDDIEIDEPAEISSSSSSSSSSHKCKNDREDKRTEREKLFEGANTDKEPRVRTVEEIMAKYRKPEDASAAAARARDRLVQRQEKLERMSQRTQELQSGAEDFAAMAKELAKTMENRKWWKL